MGALHDGHLALIDEARRHADAVVVSIFVNPLQFDVAADFDRYPRPIDDDLDVCRVAGSMPSMHLMAGDVSTGVPDPRRTRGACSDRLQGAHRPGHFPGVTTVVTSCSPQFGRTSQCSARRTHSSWRSSDR